LDELSYQQSEATCVALTASPARVYAPQLEQVLELGKNLSILTTFALYPKIFTNSLNAKSDVFLPPHHLHSFDV